MTGTVNRTTLSDRYRLERELGRGGMATVHLAHDLKHQREVAIKVIDADIAARIGVDRASRRTARRRPRRSRSGRGCAGAGDSRSSESRAGTRPAFSIDDHIVILREFLRDLVRTLRPHLTILAGFSSGGDALLVRIASGTPAGRRRTDAPHPAGR